MTEDVQVEFTDSGEYASGMPPFYGIFSLAALCAD